MRNLIWALLFVIPGALFAAELTEKQDNTNIVMNSDLSDAMATDSNVNLDEGNSDEFRRWGRGWGRGWGRYLGGYGYGLWNSYLSPYFGYGYGYNPWSYWYY